MPGKKLSQGQKRVIAKGKLAGKRQGQIAKEAGCSIATVSHAGSDPEVRDLLLAGLERNAAKMSQGLDLILDELLKDLVVNSSYTDRAAARAEMVRLVGLLRRLRGVTDEAVASEGAGEFTLAELLTAYQTVKAGKQP